MTEASNSDDKLTIMPLGAGRSVGRSCFIIEYHGYKVMLDCGIHPGYENMGGLPFLDVIDPEKIDILLVSHFHIDHIAGVPWLLTQSQFKGQCYMTHATKSISKILLHDFVRVSNHGTNDNPLFSKLDLNNIQPKITTVDFHQVITHKGIRMTCYPAGHVIGACMWLLEIDGVKILYTGDFSLENERHLAGAEIPKNTIGEILTPDILMIESTHGITRNESREEREYRFIESVKKIISRGGNCLIPIFALGRAQELLIILDEYWEAHPELARVPIYYGSNLAKKSIDVYSNYRQTLGNKILSSKAKFDLPHVSYIKSTDEIDDTYPCVVLCAPAMLQSGMSRTIFDKWASNPVNGVIIPGYVVENTLAKQLFNEPSEVETLSGAKIPRKISIDYVSFSGHSDFLQTSRFIAEIRPKRIVLIHGVEKDMMNLKSKLLSMYAVEGVEVFTPAICEEISFNFQSNPTAMITGKLSEESSKISGLFIKKQNERIILSPEDLGKYTSLKTTNFHMKQEVSIDGKLNDYVPILKRYFSGVYVFPPKLVMIGYDLILQMKDEDNSVTIEWQSDPTTDMIADNIALMFSCGAKSLNMPENSNLFPEKLTEALQSRFGESVSYDPDSQLIMMEYKDRSFLIPLDADSPCGVNIECDSSIENDPQKDEIIQIITNLASSLYMYSSLIAMDKKKSTK